MKNDILYKILFISIIFIADQVSAAQVSVIPSNKTVAEGEIFTLNVSIDPMGTAIAGAQLNIEFDRTMLNVNDIIEGNLFRQDSTITAFNSGIIDNSIGSVKNIYSVILGPYSVVSPETFIIINATATGSKGQSGIDLSNVIISDPKGNYIDLNVINGSVEYNAESYDFSPPAVSNPVASHEIPDDTDNDPLWGETSQLDVIVTDDSSIGSVTVDLSGIGGPAAKPMLYAGGNLWSISTNASTGTPPGLYDLRVNATDIFGNSNTGAVVQLRVMKNGDTTGNGVVNIGDALRCANNVSFRGNPAYALSSPYIADVTGNGIINIGDCLRLANSVSFPGNLLYMLK